MIERARERTWRRRTHSKETESYTSSHYKKDKSSSFFFFFVIFACRSEKTKTL